MCFWCISSQLKKGSPDGAAASSSGQEQADSGDWEKELQEELQVNSEFEYICGSYLATPEVLDEIGSSQSIDHAKYSVRNSLDKLKRIASIKIKGLS